MNENDKILKKLDILIRISLINAITGKSLREQVRILSLVNFRPKEIADILGKKPNHISVILNDLKKSK